MTMNEYQIEAMRTASGVTNANNENLILNGAMGLCGEAGEVIDMLKKYMYPLRARLHIARHSHAPCLMRLCILSARNW